LLNKSAGASGAERVRRHLPGLFQAVLKPDNEGALPPDLNNGLGVGVAIEQTGGNGQGAAVLAPVELLGDNGFAGTGNAGGNNVIKAAQPAQ
jgi:hypothetical protein